MGPLDYARWYLVETTMPAGNAVLVRDYPLLQGAMKAHQAFLAQVYQAIQRPGYNPPPSVVAAYIEAVGLVNRWPAADESIVTDLRAAAAKAVELGKLRPEQRTAAGLGLLPAIVAAVALILAVGLVFIGKQSALALIKQQSEHKERLDQLRSQVLQAVLNQQLPADVVPDVIGNQGGGGGITGAVNSLGVGAFGIAALAAVLLFGSKFSRGK